MIRDEKERFLTALAGHSDPETKRKIIGREFIRVFEDAARQIVEDAGEHGAEVKFLVQGTLYPDVVESGGGEGAANIKSHHNVGGLPDDLQFSLVEPLRTLFKDEVRAVGRELGVPEEIVARQPFPGPGLGIRIVGEVTADRRESLGAAGASGTFADHVPDGSATEVGFIVMLYGTEEDMASGTETLGALEDDLCGAWFRGALSDVSLCAGGAELLGGDCGLDEPP